MKALKELALLKVPSLVSERSTPEPEERVVELFRNRAELKKAYGEVQTEIHRLKDRLKQQEGATQRVEEMLEALESRLAITETAFPALVFYQLRGLWLLGRQLITQLVADLSRQNEERERKLHLAEFNRGQFTRRQALEAEVHDAEGRCTLGREQVLELEQRRAMLTRFWHYFRRRELDAKLVEARRELEAHLAALTGAEQAMSELEGTAAAEFPGLSIEARRAINLAAIAYAELLCTRLARTPLLRLAREAVGRRVATDDYGTRAQCEAYIGEIERARSALQQRSNLTEELRGRLERLRRTARYHASDDSTPSPESLGSEPQTGGHGNGPAHGIGNGGVPNVLAEDTFDLFRIVLR
jgi:hypothetical protein